MNQIINKTDNIVTPKAIEGSITYDDLDILESEINSYLGYKEHKPDDNAQKIINDLLIEIKEICRPRFGYKIVEGEVLSNTSIMLDNVKFKPMPIIMHSYKEGDYYAVVISTVGKEMDEWIHSKYVSVDIMKAYVSDSLGSVVAEAVNTYADKYLKEKMANYGMNISNSYSPGYCGWNIFEQHKLFTLLPDLFCGVKLCKSSLMLPIKSVSSVLSVGPNVVKHAYGCAICNKKNCYKRNLV